MGNFSRVITETFYKGHDTSSNGSTANVLVGKVCCKIPENLEKHESFILQLRCLKKVALNTEYIKPLTLLWKISSSFNFSLIYNVLEFSSFAFSFWIPKFKLLDWSKYLKNYISSTLLRLMKQKVIYELGKMHETSTRKKIAFCTKNGGICIFSWASWY